GPMTLLAWRRYGPESEDGVPLVLLHAFPVDSQMWTYVITAMPQVLVLTVDAPGFGLSPPLEGGLEEYADAVAATLEHAGIDRAAIAGLSMGGYTELALSRRRLDMFAGIERAAIAGLSMGVYTALALAQRRPDLFAGIGLLDTKAGADPAEGRAKRLQMAQEALGAAGSTVVEPTVDTLLGPDPEEEV